jgi:hypothetical protein
MNESKEGQDPHASLESSFPAGADWRLWETG